MDEAMWTTKQISDFPFLLPTMNAPASHASFYSTDPSFIRGRRVCTGMLSSSINGLPQFASKVRKRGPNRSKYMDRVYISTNGYVSS